MRQKLHCSFCGKSEAEVQKLAAGPGGIHICDECVAVCQVVMQGEGCGLHQRFDPRTWPKERLLALLAPLNATSETHRKHLQDVVETLRGHGVSWANIADALGISRQTAWERFS